MYRVSLTFEPQWVQLRGQRNGAYQFTRGCWRVLGCEWTTRQLPVITCVPKVALFMWSVRKTRRGMMANPRKMLAEYWAEMRAAPLEFHRVVNVANARPFVQALPKELQTIFEGNPCT